MMRIQIQINLGFFKVRFTGDEFSTEVHNGG